MSKPQDRRSSRLKEQYDELDDYDTSSTRKVVREAKRSVKKAMTRHDRNAGKRDLQRRLNGDNDDQD